MKKLAVLSLLLSPFVYADIFDAPENLQVLPEEIDAAELRATMVEFTRALGVRCSTCHEGEEGQPLSTYDFAADEKQSKRTARSMIQMVRSINSNHLNDSNRGAAVACVTCHRGVARPVETQQELVEALQESGFPELEQRYRSLRQRYYGTHSYDFSERVLVDVAKTVLGESPRLATKILQLNLEYFPTTFDTRFVLGQLHRHLGEYARARESFRAALDVRRDPRVIKALAELDQAEEP